MNSFFFFQSALLPSGWQSNVRIQVRDQIIESVTVQALPSAGDIVEALVVPGMPNLHSHAFQRALAGLAERLGSTDDDFWSWRDVMYRFLQRLEADDLEAIAAYAYADMLEAGFTSVAEFHYLHRDVRGRLYANPAELALRHLAAADATGIGLTLLPVFYETGDFGGAPPGLGQLRFITDQDTFAQIVAAARSRMAGAPGRNVGIAPHSLRAVTAQRLQALLRDHPAGPVHIHAAEQIREVSDCLAHYGLRPVEWLLEKAGVDQRWCVVHATHLTDSETSRLARSGAVAGLCPITEANLGDGIFPTSAYREAMGRWGIGTDSNIAIDAAAELRQLEYAQRLSRGRRNTLASVQQPSTGRAVYDLATAGGARALGMPIGAIAPGHRADFVALDCHHPDLATRSADTVLDTWIFAGGRSLIRSVIAGGTPVVQAGCHRHRYGINKAYLRVLRSLTA